MTPRDKELDRIEAFRSELFSILADGHYSNDTYPDLEICVTRGLVHNCKVLACELSGIKPHCFYELSQNLTCYGYPIILIDSDDVDYHIEQYDFESEGEKLDNV